MRVCAQGQAPDGRGVVADFEGEARGLCADAETCKTMLRAGTSVNVSRTV